MDDINICTTNVVASTSNNHQEFQDFTPPPSQHHHQTQEFHSLPYHQKPLKKRCKWIKDINNNDEYNGIVMSTGTSGGSVVKPKTKYTKKPDPNAPKITPPCSVCGRKFWSWKALFGHMRCHPERQWRGINPPSNFRPHPNLATSSSSSYNDNRMMSMKDHEAAGWLLMLANSPPAIAASYSQPIITSICDIVIDRVDDGRFECSSCKKVFGSHQALGGHRASHRNVKGCFANAKNDDEENARIELPNDSLDHQVRDAAAADKEEEKVFGHQCSICLKVFSSGQALGGHKRCHWEKGDDDEASLIHVPEKEGWCLDLNLPAPLDDGSSCCTYSTSGLTILDLRLGT